MARYPHKGFTKRIKKWVLARDSHYCQFCYSTENLCVHHINGWKRYSYTTPSEAWNLITLCNVCHGKTHRGQINKRTGDFISAQWLLWKAKENNKRWEEPFPISRTSPSASLMIVDQANQSVKQYLKIVY